MTAEWITGPLRRRLLAAAVVLVGGAVLIPLIMQLPLLGYDWQFCFEAADSIFTPWGHCYNQYPPWTYWILQPWTVLPWRIGLSFQLGMLLMAVAVTTAQGASRYGEAVILALLTPPVLWIMWLGQIDGLAMWGLMFLPFGILWALMKPNIAVWALLVRREWVALAVVLGAVSLVIWGWWPDVLVEARRFSTSHASAMGWITMGWPVLVLGLILFPFSGPDPLRLMASGVLLTPFFMPYHYLMLLPALGRVRGLRRWILWLLVWTTLAVAAFGGWTRYLALSFPVAVWTLTDPDPFERHALFLCRSRRLVAKTADRVSSR